MDQARRKILYLAVSACCQEVGFQSAENSVIETLTTILLSLIAEIGRTSQLLCEHNSRNEVTYDDIKLALIELGLNFSPDYAKRRNIIRLPSPAIEPQIRDCDILPAGQKRPHDSYIPDYYPQFPDPHSYIRTPTIKKPDVDYEALRDRAACQKQDIEKALAKFLAKIYPSPPEHSFFGSHTSLNKFFPLVAHHKKTLWDGLLPREDL